MKCPDFETLMAYLDGELEEDQKLLLEEHLRACDDCSRILESQRELEESWRDSFVYPGDEGFRRLESEIFGRFHRRSWWRTLAPVAAALIVAFLGVKLIMRNGLPMPMAPETVSSTVTPSGVTRGALQERGEFEDSESPADTSFQRGFYSADGYVEEQQEDGPDDLAVGPEELAVGPEELAVGPEELAEAPEEQAIEEIIVSADRTESVPEQTVGAASIVESGSAEAPAAGTAMGLDDVTDGSTTTYGGSAGLVGPDMVAQEEIHQDLLELDADASGLAADETVISAEEGQEAAAGASGEPHLSENRTSTGSLEEEEEAESLETMADLCYCRAAAGPEMVTLAFDSLGMPDSATTALLDSLSPGWRDYIHHDLKDTVMVVPSAEVCDLFLPTDGVPAEMQQ